MLSKPLKLPEATILFGPPGHGQQELAQAIGSLDNGLEFADLDAPFYSATRTMFFEFDRIDSAPDVLLDTELPFENASGRWTVKDWMSTQRRVLIDVFGKDAAARLAIAALEAQPILQDRILFLAVYDPLEAQAIIQHFGGATLVLKCGPMNGLTFSCPTLHMVSADAGERMRQLRHELGDLF